MTQITRMLNPQANVTEPQGYSGIVGTSIVVIGSITALLAYLKYRRIAKQIEAGQYRPGSSIISVVAILMFTIGFILSWYLIDSF